MADNADLDDVGRFVERFSRRAGSHSRLWITVWLIAILSVTTVAALRQAPTAAYVVLVVVTIVAISANGQHEETM